MRSFACGVLLLVAACGGGDSTGPNGNGPDAAPVEIGDVHAGNYNLGPVDWSQSVYHNSCGDYPTGSTTIQDLEGSFLAGTDNSFNGAGQLCDACIRITTGKGQTLTARVITTGVSNGPNDLDLSPQAYDALFQNEYPRAMSWQLTRCPGTGKIYYQFQTQANVDWTSLWVRDASLPIIKVEVMSAKHASFYELTRGSDGTLTDAGGFGAGSFTLRVTAEGGSTVTDTFPSFNPGDLLSSAGQF